MNQKSNSWLGYGLAITGVITVALFCYFKPSIAFFSEQYEINIKHASEGGFFLYLGSSNIDLSGLVE